MQHNHIHAYALDEQTPFRILAAGQCPQARSLLNRCLNESDVPILSASTASEIISRLDELAPDLIVVDADCSAPSGLELCRALKEHPSTMMIPVVVVGRSSKRRLEAFSAGADDFVMRQARPELLLARLRALVRMAAARRKVAAAQLTAEIEQREKIRQMFRRYLSPRLADRILSDFELRDTLLEKSDLRTRAVVLFADMRGFTSVSERLSPDEVVPLLNEYFSLLTEITFQHEGTVFHMAGDCLMVGFGVPLEQPDSTERAIAAAQEMLDRFSALAASWKERHGIVVGLGIGINEGDVIAANVGSPTFMNYTIIGDTVNVASRLSQRARAGEMLFSRSIKHSLDERGIRIRAMKLPPLTLRGRSSPIDIYCVPRETRLDVRGQFSGA